MLACRARLTFTRQRVTPLCSQRPQRVNKQSKLYESLKSGTDCSEDLRGYISGSQVVPEFYKATWSPLRVHKRCLRVENVCLLKYPWLVLILAIVCLSLTLFFANNPFSAISRASDCLLITQLSAIRRLYVIRVNRPYERCE